jgi:hypothetical protein
MNNNFLKNNQVNYTTNCIFYTNGDNLTYMPFAHTGFKNLEEKHAEIVSQNGGHILEVGFGLGFSTEKFISSSIDSYTCIEINDVVYQHAVTWSLDKQNVTIINGAWEDIIPTLTTKYDGIYYGPLNVNYNQFYETCKLISKIGTIISTQGFTFEFPASLANIEDNVPTPDLYDETFTEQLYNSLVDSEYYKVYWQIYNGTEYVKSLN